ncbi:MAG: ATP-binding cassette domain-containing protein, partial [Symbiobacteriaceae bacterium]|nr:ATP-binding cassette domain-containing protein [Symbiobacteriaceae bacterium]
MDDYLLRVNNLNLSVPAKGKRFLAVSDLSFALKAGGSLGIVGESGSGKTLTALAIAGLNNPQVQLESGSILFNRQELTSLPETDLRSLRGSELAVIFQDSGGALNPTMRVGDQVSEGLLLGEGMAL